MIRLTDIGSDTTLRMLTRRTAQAQSQCGTFDLTETRASGTSVPKQERLEDAFGSVYQNKDVSNTMRPSGKSISFSFFVVIDY